MRLKDFFGVFSTFGTQGGFLKNQKPNVRTMPWKPSSTARLGASFPLGTPKKHCNAGVIPPPPNMVNGIPVNPPGQIPSVIKLFTVNPVTIPASPATKIMLANGGRVRWSVTNVSTDIIFLGLGKIPSVTSYDHVLPACISTANDGSGGVIVDEAWLGEVWAIALTGGVIAITEDP